MIKNRHLPQNYKKNAFLEKFRRSLRKTERRRSTEWFERDFKDMPEAEFVANFRLSREAFSKLCQEIGPYIKKEDTFAIIPSRWKGEWP